jgi:hypothetical protein
MGEARRKREAKRDAILRKRLGGAPLDLHLFRLSSIKPPQSAADLPLAMWKLQIGLETLGRLGRGELFCVVCDEAIALAPPPFTGFIKADLVRFGGLRIVFQSGRDVQEAGGGGRRGGRRDGPPPPLHS